jgi:hypothetical protein
MEPEHNLNDQHDNADQEDHKPFDGFVNVNEVVRKRRQQRNKEFNISGLTGDVASGTGGSKDEAHPNEGDQASSE